GLLLATPATDGVRTVMLTEGDGRLGSLAAELLAETTGRFRMIFGVDGQDLEVAFDCRYRGQSHELEVVAPVFWPEARQGFEAAHRRKFGFVREGEPIEVVNIRVRVAGRAPLTWDQVSGQRPELPAGTEMAGPSVLTEETSAILLEEGDRITVLE